MQEVVLHGNGADTTRLTRNPFTPKQHTREVVSPQGTNLVLTANIPDIKLCVLVGNGFDVEANGGDGGDILVEFELVQDGCGGKYG